MGSLVGPISSGETVLPGAVETYIWVYQALSSTALPFSFTAVASGQDLSGPVFNLLTFSAQIEIQPNIATLAYQPASLKLAGGAAMPASLTGGQVITIQVSISNTGSAGDAAAEGVTPSVSGLGIWSQVNLVSFSYVTGAPSTCSFSPLSVTPGSVLALNMVLSVSVTGVSSGQPDTIVVHLGGTFNDSKPSSNDAITGTMTFNLSIQPGTTVPGHPLVNELFLSDNFFTPAVQSLQVCFSVATNTHMTIPASTTSPAGLVKTLFDGNATASSTAGSASYECLPWNGTADDSLAVSSGTYLILMDAGSWHTVKKVNVLR